jgi:predicted nuclease of restriction endonuclease-like (RecB) superfamily
MNAVRSHFTWTHYRLLLRITIKIKRNFYEAESTKNNWSSRQLERQINSQLYERLLLSSNPSDV